MDRPSRKFLGLALPELCVLLAYVALLCYLLPHYQPWEDEGRAWMDSRFFGLFTLVFHVLRYEGHPAIWYLILWPLAHLHVPFLAINWLAAAFATAGVWFLLRHAPFPFVLRALLPFGFTLAYEYAVVARGYVLYPLLGFLVAHEYRQPMRRPVRMAVALALLANLTVHGTIVAAFFGLSYAWQIYRERRNQPVPAWRLAAAVFAASMLFVVIVLWPARDLKAPVGPHLGNLLHKAAPAVYHPAEAPIKLLRIADPALSTAVPYAPNLGMGLGALNLRQRLFTVFVYPIANFGPLAVLLLALVYLLVCRRGHCLLLAGHLLMSIFIIEVYIKLWHVSMVWVTLVVLLWAVWDPQDRVQLPRHTLSRPRLTLQNAVAAVFTLVCILQLGWTIHAVRFVSTHSTYPAQAAADYLKSLPRKAKVDGFDHAFTLLPYFDRRFPYHLYQDVLDVPKVLADNPDVILFRDLTVPAGQLSQLSNAGYYETRKFCGTPFFPNQPLVPLCLVVLQK